jgi:hypothetical protein
MAPTSYRRDIFSYGLVVAAYEVWKQKVLQRQQTRGDMP